MTQPSTGHLCRDCKHMKPDDVDSSWCFSPQLAQYQQRATRAIFERDSFDEGRTGMDTRKCGPDGLNFEAKA